MKSLREIRLENNKTQMYCAQILGISLRSYKDYETNFDKVNSIKYKYLIETLNKHFEITETKGILSIEKIKSICISIFKKYDISYCYLFGSYAKGTATETSDIDLFIKTNITGLDFFGLAEELRENLHKEIDLLDTRQIENNSLLALEILESGVKIYGKHQG